MWHGDEQRVRLDTDLTRYHRHLKPGVTGRLVPGVKTTEWGNSDRFGAVNFDCCEEPESTLDIVLANLTFLDVKKEPVVQEDAREAVSAELDEILGSL